MLANPVFITLRRYIAQGNKRILDFIAKIILQKIELKYLKIFLVTRGYSWKFLLNSDFSDCNSSVVYKTI